MSLTAWWFLINRESGQMGYYCLIQRGGHLPGWEGSNHLVRPPSLGQIRWNTVTLEFSIEGAWRERLGDFVLSLFPLLTLSSLVTAFALELTVKAEVRLR